MNVILVGGLWLPADVWQDVIPALAERGHRGLPVSLPGQGDGNLGATLTDQLGAVVAAVDTAQERVVVVGHSASSTLAWLAADARPDQVAAVGLIGGFPFAEGELYADFFEVVDGAMPFPGWGPFEGSDSADLDEAALGGLAEAAIPVPEGVTRAPVHYTDQRRFDVPVTLICPEFTPEDAKGWIDAGDVPELVQAQVHYVDLKTGHWPMVSAPADLAGILADLADEADGTA